MAEMPFTEGRRLLFHVRNPALLGMQTQIFQQGGNNAEEGLIGVLNAVIVEEVENR